MKYMISFCIFLIFVTFLHLFLIRLCKNVVKWVGSGRGSSRLVQNDQRNCRNIFKQVLAKDSWKKNYEKHEFPYVPSTPVSQYPGKAPNPKPHLYLLLT